MFNSSQGRFFVGIFITSILSACGSSDYSDIQEFMATVERDAVIGIAEIPSTDQYQSFAYAASNLRSPFVPPVVVAVESEVQRVNRGVKPPKNHRKQFLERFNLATLSMVGTMKQGSATWALIQDGDGGVHRVQVGDYLGTSFGKIESIYDSRIDLTEIVTNGADGWLRRPRMIELKKPD